MLLRALETRATRRVGGNLEVRHDVRVVAATNRNLAEEVRGKRFREDLFFRLGVARVRLPPLRERPEDVPLLARVFATRTGATLTPELLAVLAAYHWPGNVRELRNTVERIAVGGAPMPLAVDAAPAARPPWLSATPLPSLPDARQQAGEAFERAYLEEALARADGNLARAAELAGVSRQMLTRLAAKHGLRGRDRGE
jgi:DNA-binding NtrC family response regulator